MTRLVPAVLAAAAALTLTACGDPQAADRQQADQQQAADRERDALAAVTSVCDQHGNRVYVYGGRGVAVVGADPSCVGGPIR